jgi:hypothetical protein
MWWCMLIIPVTQELKIGGSRFKASPDKVRDLISKNKLGIIQLGVYQKCHLK